MTHPQHAVGAAFMPVHRSWRLAVMIAVVGVLASVAVLVVAGPSWIKAVVISFIFAACAWAVWRDAWLLSDTAIVAVRPVSDTHLEVRQRDARTVVFDAASDSSVLGALIVIRLRTSGGKRRARSVLLLPDAAAPDDLRQLRAWLRWQVSWVPEDSAGPG